MGRQEERFPEIFVTWECETPFASIPKSTKRLCVEERENFENQFVRDEGHFRRLRNFAPMICRNFLRCECILILTNSLGLCFILLQPFYWRNSATADSLLLMKKSNAWTNRRGYICVRLRWHSQGNPKRSTLRPYFIAIFLAGVYEMCFGYVLQRNLNNYFLCNHLWIVVHYIWNSTRINWQEDS